MPTTTSTKMGIKPGMRTIFVNAPADAIPVMDLPNLEVKEIISGEFDYIHFFAKNQANLHEQFPILKDHLKVAGMLWVSWPKAR